MTRLSIVHATFLWLILSLSVYPAVAMDLESASSSAREWVECIDSERYEKCWHTAAPFFTERVSVDEWIASVSAARGHLGTVEQRTVQAAELKRSLPDAPDGEYAIIRFRTIVEGGRELIETVTMMRVHASWKASGYFIRPTTRDSSRGSSLK